MGSSEWDPYTSLGLVEIGARAGRPEPSLVEEVTAALERDRDPAFAGLDDEALVLEVRTRASEIASAKCAYLDAVRELVVRGVWAQQGCKTPADWLSWATGCAGPTARADVRVALRLPDYPATHEVFSRGLISFSQVRAIVRSGHPEIEVVLLQLATYSTGADLERVIRTAGQCQARARVDEVEAWERRTVSTRMVDESVQQLTLTLPADEVVRVRELFEHRATLERKEIADARQRAIDAGADEDDLAAVPSVSVLTADLMLEAMNAWLADEPQDATGQERHTLVIHVAAHKLDSARSEDDPVPAWTGSGRHVPGMSARAIRRMLCEASWMAVTETVDGEVVELTGLTREVPPAIRRLLMLRDKSCRYPGCGSRRNLHAHHILYVENGGPTVPSNLVLLCGHHHRFVHAEDVEILHDGHGRFRFRLHGADTPLQPVLAMIGADPDAIVRRRQSEGRPAPPPASTHPDFHGFDLVAAVDAVLAAIGKARPPDSPVAAA